MLGNEVFRHLCLHVTVLSFALWCFVYKGCCVQSTFLGSLFHACQHNERFAVLSRPTYRCYSNSLHVFFVLRCKIALSRHISIIHCCIQQLFRSRDSASAEWVDAFRNLSVQLQLTQKILGLCCNGVISSLFSYVFALRLHVIHLLQHESSPRLF